MAAGMLSLQKLLLYVVFLSLTASCCCFSKWSGADTFLAHLKCGMSRSEVTDLVRDFHGVTLRESHYAPEWDLVAVKGDTMIFLDFADSGLQRVRLSWIDAPFSRKSSPPQDLCSK